MSDRNKLSDERLGAVNGGAGNANGTLNRPYGVDYQIIDPKKPTAGPRASYSSMEEAMEELPKFPGCVIKEVRV